MNINVYKQTSKKEHIMSNKQNVFLSYHHDYNASSMNKHDTQFKEDLEKMYLDNDDVSIVSSLQDAYNSSIVTILLIGNSTFKNQYIDSEVSFSFEVNDSKAKNGLIGIVLPSYSDKLALGSFPYYGQIKLENSTYCVDEKIFSKDLLMNIESGFVKLYDWSNNPQEIEKWIHEAHDRSLIIEEKVS